MNTTNSIVSNVWSFCDTLRDDAITSDWLGKQLVLRNIKAPRKLR